MATYYVDPAATGLGDGTSWTNAWTTLQAAIDGTGGTQPTAGDTVLCRGTETVSVEIDFDGNSGTAAGGNVEFVGVNASGVEDGTRFVLNGNNNSMTAVAELHASQLEIRNFEFKNCGGSGHGCRSSGTYVDNVCFINCSFNNNAGGGLVAEGYQNSIKLEKSEYICCQFHDNGTYGVYFVTGLFYGCEFYNNPTGWYMTGSYGTATFSNCIFRDNSNTGAYLATYGQQNYAVQNCVFHGNGTGLGLASNQPVVSIVGCRFTSNTTGLEIGTVWKRQLIACYFPDTGSPLANTTNITGGGTYANVAIRGVATGDFAGTDADGGYVDSANDNYSLAASASIRNVEIGVGINSKTFATAGLEAEAVASSGGSGGGSIFHPLAQ